MNATTPGNRSGRQAGPAPSCLVLLFLAGCATPTPLTSVIGGIEITEHVDEKMPHGCEQAFPAGGCYQMMDGKHNIWYSVVSWPYVRKHEIAHALGMQHSTPWIWDGNQHCAVVTASGGGYLQDQRICIGKRGEYTADIAYENQQVGRLAAAEIQTDIKK
jgi:hypothetical protein